VGVATGPLSVGLGGSDHLVYDIWGPTVSEAYLLARSAPPGSVLVAEGTRQRLPAEASSPSATTTTSSGGTG
jgi:class 3 adenylate cyclase